MIRQAVERPISTLIGAFTLVVLGTFSLLRLPVSLLPSVERPSLEVTVAVEGRSREEVLDQVTRPLEHRLASLAGVTSVRTLTGDGFARARVESEWQTDADRLRIEAERRLADLTAPGNLSIEMTAGDPEPIVEVAVLGGASGADRTAFARKLLLPELARLPGAGRVETVGLTPRHVVVRPLSAALAARGLTAADLVGRLRPVGLATPAGRARSGAAVRPLLVREEAASLEALRALRIPGPRGESVLGDVARISLEEVVDGTSFRLDGRDGVLVRVFRAPEANAVSLAARVRERTAELSKRTGAGLRLEVVEDRSREVAASLADLGTGALLGLLIGTGAIRIFLGRWRPTLALAVVVPASVLTAFAGFHLAGTSLDVISLAGLALGAGMLVDSSIVVLEAIETARARGEHEPAIAGTRQIALPVVASFLTSAVVFLPLFSLKGLARAFFGVQAFAIVTTLAASLLFSLTVTPVLSGNTTQTGAGRSPGRRAYLRLLDAALARPALAVLAGIAVVAVAGIALVLLPRELVPDAETRELVVRYRLAPDLAPEAARRLGREVEDCATAALAPRESNPAGVAGISPGFQSRESGASPNPRSPARGDRNPAGEPLPPLTGLVERAGLPSSPGLKARANSGRPYGAGFLARRTATQLLPSDDREETGRLVLAFPDPAAAERARPVLQTALSRLPGVEAWVEPRTSAFVEPIEQAGRRLEVMALAATPERAGELAGRASRRLREAGLRERPGQRSRPQEALLLSWDLARLAELGADRGLLEAQVRQGLGEQTAGRVRMDTVEPEIRIEAAEPADPALLPVAVQAAGPGAPGAVPLAAVARIAPGARPAVLERQDGRPAVRLAFDGSTDTGALLAGLAQGADEELAPGGEALELRRAFGQLRLALLLSVVLVFLTVAALYESFKIPLVVMTTVPVALGGALGLLLLTGQSLDVLSFLGLILLAGIVVNNAIVLVHRIEEHRRAGEPMDSAIRLAAAERYRPILMTTLTTLAGMLPLALLGGEGVELRRSLAIAVMGGMVTSTFASLLLVPVLHRIPLPPAPSPGSPGEGEKAEAR